MGLSVLKQLGHNVRRRRLELGLSQEELAERAGLHRTYIGGIERGERNVSLVNLVQLANTLRTPLVSLLAGIGTAAKNSPQEVDTADTSADVPDTAEPNAE